MACQSLLMTVVLSFELMFSLVSAPAWAENSTPGSAAQDDEESSPSPSQSSPPEGSLRSQVRLAMRHTLKTLATAPYTEAHAMVKLYVQLQSDESLPSGERERFQNLVRTRLAQGRIAIVRGLRRRQMETERTARRRESDNETSVRGLKPSPREGGSADKSMAEDETPSAPQNRLEGQAAGGNPQSEGQELIELIESTIAPASWESRGGPGVIKYWADGHALVIRQTREVHEQIGGVVGAKRP